VQLIEPASEVSISVKDTGIGIPEECLPHIFERFFRVEKKVHTIKGTGLGLTIVKRIIEKHNGRITAESEIGHGSTFTIFLPAAVPEALPHVATADGAPGEEQAERDAVVMNLEKTVEMKGVRPIEPPASDQVNDESSLIST
jgi:hypothetical protein